MGSLKYIAILFLSFLGIVYAIKSTAMFLCKSSKRLYTLIIPVDNSCKNPEQLIRSGAMHVQWSDSKEFDKIYCIGNRLNDEKREICVRVCGEYPNVQYFDINNFEKTKFFDE